MAGAQNRKKVSGELLYVRRRAHGLVGVDEHVAK
jgi:hypothetical protein